MSDDVCVNDLEAVGTFEGFPVGGLKPRSLSLSPLLNPIDPPRSPPPSSHYGL
jgi:hypothetical protein